MRGLSWIVFFLVLLTAMKLGSIYHYGENDQTLKEVILRLDEIKTNYSNSMENTIYNSSMTLEEISEVRKINSINTFIYANFYILFNIMEYGMVVGYNNPDMPYTLLMWSLGLISIFLFRGIIIFIMANIYLLFKLVSKVFTRGII